LKNKNTTTVLFSHQQKMAGNFKCTDYGVRKNGILFPGDCYLQNKKDLRNSHKVPPWVAGKSAVEIIIQFLITVLAMVNLILLYQNNQIKIYLSVFLIDFFRMESSGFS
jgi:hypothetical protein